MGSVVKTIMIKLKPKMTTEELAACLDVTKQTINRWIREQGWRTEKIPGVKGGRARLIHIDHSVRDFLTNAPALRTLSIPLQAHEPAMEYGTAETESPLGQIYHILQNMTLAEQQQLAIFLAREGIRGFVDRLGIGEG